jgi:hypothetical protein
MKHAKWVVLVMLVALSGLATAQLISSTRMVAQVPFEFVVANKVVPAGEYIVQAASMDGRILKISNASGKMGLFTPTSPTEGRVSASHYALVFTRYGDVYFLSGIKLQGSKISYRLPQSKAEAELRAQKVSAGDETLLATRK